MRIMDTAQVLAKIQAYSNRNVDEAVITVWHEILEPLELQDCLRAVTDHYRDSKEWLMPSDIVSRVRTYREARLNKFPNGILLSPEDERQAIESKGGMQTYRDACRSLRHLAANGELTPAAYEAYQDGKLQLELNIPKEITQ